jgi:regulator of protease activity HflC (stomatin/prohibitin superfamily)
MLFALIAAGVVLVAVLMGVRFVPEGHAGLVERSGAYRRTMHRRLGWLVPFLDHLKLVELRPYTLTLGSEPFRSSDEVQLLAALTLRFQALDPVRATYEVEDLRRGVEQLAVHELREIISSSTGGDLLRNSDGMSKQLEHRLARVEAAWGVYVDAVEVSLRLFLTPLHQRDSRMKAPAPRREAVPETA